MGYFHRITVGDRRPVAARDSRTVGSPGGHRGHIHQGAQVHPGSPGHTRRPDLHRPAGRRTAGTQRAGMGNHPAGRATVNNVACEASHAVCEGGCIYQSAEECSARSVDGAFDGDAVLAGNVACSSELVHYFPAPAAGLACVRFVDQERLGACLPRFPQWEPPESVVSEREKGTDAFAS